MNIGVVIVTYNRINHLKKALNLYEKQTYIPEYIIVINNNSTDETNDFLKEWEMEQSEIDKQVINLSDNIGGSGGFYTGLKKALELNCEWIWVADDDAYPEKEALNNTIKYIKNNEDYNIAAICGQVINNGEIDISHRKRVINSKFNINQISVPEYEYKNNSFELDLFSYVGVIINKEYLKRSGLPEKDYFIYYDDTEHSYRLSKLGKIVCVPSIKIIHNVETRKVNKVDWKGYYMIRNRMLFLKKHFNKKYYKYNYIIFFIKTIIKDFIKKDKIRNKQIRVALGDSRKNIKGMHNLYKPGWEKKET